jgi:xanthine dehydrogenase YagR molybdenum-binding subunit
VSPRGAEGLAGALGAAMGRAQDGDQPPRPPKPGKKWVKTTKVVDGHEREEWIEVDIAGGPSWPERSAMRVLHQRLPRVDGPEKVTGAARYPHDVRLPGMLFARLLLCPHPCAKVELDLEPARKLRGVHAVRSLRPSDLPAEEDWITRYLGQPVAAVAAETPELAEDALRAIAARFDERPFAVTREQALAPNAPQVRRDGNLGRRNERGDREAAEKALATADAVIEATYVLPVQHHLCLETHGLVADYRGGDEATVYASTQGTFAVHGEVPRPLGLKPGQVTTLVPHMGGGFGSKFGPGVEGVTACELARELKRPVHLLLTRADEFLTAGNRSGCVQTVRAGATKDGKLAALVATIDRLGGIGGGSHAGLPYIYTCGASYSEMRSVHTNTDGSRAFRAPGHPQASFAMESVMDELACAIGMDRLAFRLANLGQEVWKRQLERVAREIGWEAHGHKAGPDLSDALVKEGIGFGVSTWGGGGSAQCEVEVRIARDGGASVFSGTQDLGTGTRTYVAAIVAEEFGLALGEVTARIGSSAYGQANGSGGSTTAASLAPAVKDAAHKAREALLERLAPELGVRPDQLTFAGGQISGGGAQVGWKEACARLGADGITAHGTWQAELAGNGVHGAQAARVQVDTRTGEIRVVKMVCVQDCGLALNVLAAESQINGGMIQAMSYGLFEERVIDPDLGLQLNTNLDDYKIAGCREIPEMLPLIDEEDRRGVIGLGEPPVIAGHGAIANAIHNACGVRLREMPMSADKLLMGLEALRAQGKGAREGAGGRG